MFSGFSLFNKNKETKASFKTTKKRVFDSDEEKSKSTKKEQQQKEIDRYLRPNNSAENFDPMAFPEPKKVRADEWDIIKIHGEQSKDKKKFPKSKKQEKEESEVDETDIEKESEEESEEENEKENQQNRLETKKKKSMNLLSRNTKNRELKKQGKLSFVPGSAKMYAGTVTFDETYNKFLSMGPEELRNKYQPPHTPDLTNEELDKLLDYQKKRISNKQVLLDDEMWDFINMVAGGTKKEVRKIFQTTTSRSLGSQNFGNIYGNPTTNRTSSNRLIQGSTAIGSALSPPEEPTLVSPRISPNQYTKNLRFRNTVENESSDEEEINHQTQAEMEEQIKYQNKLRLASAYNWIEKPEVIGLMTVAPDIYTATNAAFVRLRSVRQLISYTYMNDFLPLIYTNIPDIRFLFASLTSFCLAKTNYFFPSVVPLEKLNDKIEEEIKHLLPLFTKFQWNPNTQTFVVNIQSIDNQYGAPFLQYRSNSTFPGDFFISNK